MLKGCLFIVIVVCVIIPSSSWDAVSNNLLTSNNAQYITKNSKTKNLPVSNNPQPYIS